MSTAQNRKNEIFELQNMLRVIAAVDPRIPKLNPDGIFGPKTENAVLAFQKAHGLPATGEVDLLTWDTIFEEYQNASRALSLTPILPFPSPDYRIEQGEISDTVIFIQLMMRALAISFAIFDEITPSGLYDEKTSEAIMEFQKLHGLPEDGIVDDKTWEALAKSYGNVAENGLYKG